MIPALDHPLDYRQRTLARAIFRRIQQRLPYPVTVTSCPVCELDFTDNPTCGIHPGLCCHCANAAAKLEQITLSHMVKS